MSNGPFWATFVGWLAAGFLIAHLLTRRWYRLHRRWLSAVSQRAGGGSSEGRSSVLRWYWELLGSMRSGFGYRSLQPDPDPAIESLRLASLSEWRRLTPSFVIFAVCWLGGFALLTRL
jgi:hypothetical protein